MNGPVMTAPQSETKFSRIEAFFDLKDNFK
jgi:hypothetical protein